MKVEFRHKGKEESIKITEVVSMEVWQRADGPCCAGDHSYLLTWTTGLSDLAVYLTEAEFQQMLTRLNQEATKVKGKEG